MNRDGREKTRINIGKGSLSGERGGGVHGDVERGLIQMKRYQDIWHNYTDNKLNLVLWKITCYTTVAEPARFVSDISKIF